MNCCDNNNFENNSNKVLEQWRHRSSNMSLTIGKYSHIWVCCTNFQIWDLEKNHGSTERRQSTESNMKSTTRLMIILLVMMMLISLLLLFFVKLLVFLLLLMLMTNLSLMPGNPVLIIIFDWSDDNVILFLCQLFFVVDPQRSKKGKNLFRKWRPLKIQYCFFFYWESLRVSGTAIVFVSQ